MKAIGVEVHHSDGREHTLSLWIRIETCGICFRF